MKALVELLDNLPPTLQVLNLSQNWFGDGLMELVHHVQHLHSLTDLNLSDNRLSDVKALIELLDNLPPTLQELKLRGNRFGDSLVELVHHVQHLHSLRKLDIRDNGVSEGVKKEIRKQLKHTLPDLEELDI